MSVKLRLARIGKKHVPFYRIVAIDSSKKRDGAFLDNLGTYDTLKSKIITFHEDRFNAWIEKGAQVTDSVKKLHKRYKKAAEGVEVPKKSKKVVAPASEQGGVESKAKAVEKKDLAEKKAAKAEGLKPAGVKKSEKEQAASKSEE